MLRLRLLGEPRLTAPSGGIIPLWRPESALLAVAAFSRDGIRREAAAALLWPESPEDRARAALRQSLFRLRRQAGDLLHADGDRLVLDDARVQVDLWELERAMADGDAERALQLHGEPFLAGFSLEGSPAFEHWVDGQRTAIHDRMVHLFSQLTRTTEATGDRSGALNWAVRWSDFAPLDEEAAEHRVRLHATCGDPTAALAAYEGFRHRLGQELGLEPSDALENLATRIREGGFRVEVGANVPPEPTRTRAVRAMVGRASELGTLLAHWKKCEAGESRFLILQGEPGIGKTRLAHELIRGLRLEGATALEGRAYEVEREVPYSALAAVLGSALDAPGLSAVETTALGELARIVPSFARRFPAGAVVRRMDPEAGRFRLLDAVYALLENLAYEAPVLLFLDDLPWADEATVAALHYAWRNLPEHPLLLLATARTGDPERDSPGHRMWASLRREAPGRVAALPLGPIPREAIARLAGPGADVPNLERRTGGNPLFLLELLRSVEEGGSISSSSPEPASSIQVVVEDRLRRISPEEQRLLEAAAVLGRSFPLPTATVMAGLVPETGAEAAVGLRRKGIIREAGVAYDFVHDLLREAVEGSLPGETRARLHQAAYRRLAPEEGSLQAAAGSETLARHAEAGGLEAQAFRWSLEAASRAETLHAAEEAAAHLGRARRMARNPEERAEAWTRTGALERAQTRFREAALSFLEAVRETEPGTPSRLGLRLRLLEASFRGGILTPEEVQGEVEGLVGEARDTGEPALLREAYMVSAVARQGVGEMESAFGDAARAVQSAEAAGEPAPLVRTLLLQAQLALAAGRAGEVLPALDRAVERAEGGELIREYFDALAERGTELSRLGRWDEAIHDWTGGLGLAIREGDYGGEAIFRLNLSDLLARRGDAEEALRHLDRLQEICGRFHFPHVEGAIPLNRALAAWFAGDAGGTVREAGMAMRKEAGNPGVALPDHTLVARSLGLLGRLALGAGRHEVRAELHELEQDGPRGRATWSDDREIVALARIRAHRALGEDEVALSLAVQSQVDVADPFGRGLLALEEAGLRSRSDPQRAIPLREEAMRILEPLGLRWPR